MLTDSLADMLTRIRNGQRARLSYVVSPSSKLRLSVLEVLKEEGYIRDFSKQLDKSNKEQVKIELKYENGPVIREISRVSKPGRRVYSSIKTLSKVYNGLGISIISTSKGVMSDAKARLLNLGGEVLCIVF